jgi:hypothetical protein
MSTPRSIAVALFAGVLMVGPASGQDKRIKRSALPPAVEQAVREQSEGATIRGFSQERENGQTMYEAELTVHGRTRDVLMDSTGAVVEVEQQVTIASLPPAVAAGLKAQAGKGRITKVETITKHGTLVAYEARVVTHGKRSAIQVGPDGKPLAHQE